MHAATDPTAYLVLLEFEYSETVRPVDVGFNDDARALALRFREISLTCDKTGDQLAFITFNGKFTDGLHQIYGLSEPEKDGTWTLGKRTAILLELPRSAPDGATVKFSYTMHPQVLPIVLVNIIANGQPVFTGMTSGDSVTFKIPPVAAADELYTDHNNLSLDFEVTPEISIAILNHERSALTIASVVSILSSRPQLSYEIIVVDNASTAEQAALFRSARLPVRSVFLSENVGFGEGNNLAAEQARGQYILFFNNDAFVTAGVLDRLHHALAGDPEAGIVGPVFLFPDGRLQEMGASINGDGGTVQHGWGEAGAELVSVPAISAVDYVSGACMMCKREEFLHVGGFLPIFDPLYYEDVDLCLRFLALGKSTKLVKDAIVYHIQNATTGATPFKRRQESALARNRETMRSRWGDWLRSRIPADLPKFATLNVGEIEAQIAGYTSESVNCLFAAEPLDGAAESLSAIAAAGALAQFRPTVLGSPTRCSVLRLVNLAGELGLPSRPLATADGSMLAELDVEVFVLSSRAFPPAVPPIGRRALLHCANPVAAGSLTEAERRARLRTLLKYEMIVTDSEFGRQSCLRILREMRAPMMRVEVVRPPVIRFGFAQSVAKENIIVSIGPFRPGPSGGSHEIVLDGYHAYRSSSPDPWRLIVCGDLGKDDGVAYLDGVRSMAQSSNIEIIVNPSGSQLERLFAKAKVYVSAVGLGAVHPGDSWMCTSNASEAGAAIAAGCVPAIADLGAAVEICEHVGVGFRFRYAREIGEVLPMAIERAGVQGLAAELRQRVEPFDQAPYHETWRRLLSGIGSTEPASLRLFPETRPVSGRAITVIGMHRSGTSAMARVISLLGAELPQELMPPTDDNPTGFWEPKDIPKLNDEILRQLGSSWDDVFSYAARRALGALPAEFIAQARQQIRSNYANKDLILLKDPRISLLNGLWERALLGEGYEPSYVIMVRDPREVAESLLIRNGFPRSTSFLLWASYMVAAERDTRGTPRVFVLYGDLVANANMVVDTLETVLQLDFPRRRASALVDVERFLRRDLRHHVFTEPWDAGAFKLINDAYEALASASGQSAVDSSIFSQLEEWLNGMDEVIGPTFASLRPQH